MHTRVPKDAHPHVKPCHTLSTGVSHPRCECVCVSTVVWCDVQAGDWSEWASTEGGGEAFVHLLAGGSQVEVSGEAGVTLAPGHIFLVPRGKRYRWRVTEPSLGLLYTNKVVVAPEAAAA